MSVPGNVSQVIPMLGVFAMEESLHYYVNGLGFVLENKWVVDGGIRWCRLTLDDAALMLQEFAKAGRHSGLPEGKVGVGVSLWFQCADAVAMYHEISARNIAASEPQVGNGLWDTRLTDPDGYHLHFVSPTDLAEETKLSEVQS